MYACPVEKEWHRKLTGFLNWKCFIRTLRAITSSLAWYQVLPGKCEERPFPGISKVKKLISSGTMFKNGFHEFEFSCQP